MRGRAGGRERSLLRGYFLWIVSARGESDGVEYRGQ